MLLGFAWVARLRGGGGRLVEIVVTLALGAVAASCKVSSSGEGPDLVLHCADANSDATCVTNDPARPYCDLCRPVSDHQGCTVARPATPACRPEGGSSGGGVTSNASTDESTSGDSGTTVGSVDTGSSEGTTGAPPRCSGPDGGFDADCEALDPAAPYCVDAMCVGCEAAGGGDFCRALDAELPACDAEAGVCTGCGEAGPGFCEADTPLCTAAGGCAGCASHSDCPGTACHLAPTDPLFGSCFEPSEVRWVDADEICPGDGTEANPSCSLAQSVAAVSAGESRVLRVDGTGATYDELVVLAQDATVAIIGAQGPAVSGVPGQLVPSIRVQDGFAYLHGMRISNNPSYHGLACSNATLWLQRSEVANNARYGVFDGAPCSLTFERTNVYGNATGGIRTLGGSLRLDNSTVGRNGDGASGPGLNLQLTAIDVVYATLAGNAATGADNVHCLDATGSVRNSIVVGEGGDSVELDCFTLSWSRNAIDTSSFTGGGGVLVSEPYTSNWFVDDDGGDFRLAAPPLSPFGDVGLWEPGDPLLDADGTARPTRGALGYAGVDEP